jgi:hypothetical protein
LQTRDEHMTRSAHRTWLPTIAGGICALMAARAGADPIDYQADAGCPDRGAFLTAAARKSPGAVGVTGAGPLKVQLRATPTGYTGVLERRGGLTAARVLSGTRCEDVAEALALTLALSLVPAGEPPAVVAAAAPPPAPPARARTLAVSAGLRGGGFVAHEPMMGPTLGVGLSRGGPEVGRFWRVGLEGGVSVSWTRSDLARTPARARFELLAMTLELCPVHAGGGRARLGLCGLAEGGLLGGRGIDIAHPRWGRTGWLALGGGLQLELSLTRRWLLLGSGQVTRPLQTTRFVFAEPAEPVARTAGVVPSAALALAARFP